MSRYTYRNEQNNEVAYGFDHVFGYFYDEFEHDNEYPIVELSSAFTGLTGVKLAELVKDFVPADRWQLMMLDLPF